MERIAIDFLSMARRNLHYNLFLFIFVECIKISILVIYMRSIIQRAQHPSKESNRHQTPLFRLDTIPLSRQFFILRADSALDIAIRLIEQGMTNKAVVGGI